MEQTDQHYAALTVQETFDFAAWCQGTGYREGEPCCLCTYSLKSRLACAFLVCHPFAATSCADACCLTTLVFSSCLCDASALSLHVPGLCELGILHSTSSVTIQEQTQECNYCKCSHSMHADLRTTSWRVGLKHNLQAKSQRHSNKVAPVPQPMSCTEQQILSGCTSNSV